MSRVYRAVALLACLLVMVSIAHAGDTLKDVAGGSQRSAAHKARDVYRHPVQTLEFFGIRPDMKVIELDPGGGWYTEILAPFLYDQGQLFEAVPPADSSSAFLKRMRMGFEKKLSAAPAIYGKVKLVDFAPPGKVELGPGDSADMVLTFRNLHNWEHQGSLKGVFKAAYDVLKPNGVFGVVAHRAKPGSDPKTSAVRLHRMPEAYVRQLAESVGFKLAGSSEVNANPRDDHTVNVHMLPPSLEGPASDHKKMRAIGESDRMTLKFVKPGP